jgi:hypothetical protein
MVGRCRRQQTNAEQRPAFLACRTLLFAMHWSKSGHRRSYLDQSLPRSRIRLFDLPDCFGMFACVPLSDRPRQDVLSFLPLHMIKLTREREITPHVSVHPDDNDRH